MFQARSFCLKGTDAVRSLFQRGKFIGVNFDALQGWVSRVVLKNHKNFPASLFAFGRNGFLNVVANLDLSFLLLGGGAHIYPLLHGSRICQPFFPAILTNAKFPVAIIPRFGQVFKKRVRGALRF